MTELGDVLTCRLVVEDERMRRQREAFEEQRQWLLSKLVSVCHDDGGGDDEKDEKRPEKRREKRRLRSRSSRCTVGVPVEERLLEYGRQRDERVEEARRIRQEEAEMAEAKLLERAEPRAQRGTRALSPSTAETLARRRAERYERLMEESTAELNFHPRISIESARLARERRLKENIADLSLPEALLRRKAMTDEQMERKRNEMHAIRAAPMITKKAKQLPLPYTAVERLYLHAKEKQSDKRDTRERLQEVIEENMEFPFHPSISERAERLQRKPGRHVYEDLYEHGLKQQQERLLVTSEEGSEFHPNINRVSELIAARMNESTTDRLLKPRQVKSEEAAPRKLLLCRKDLDRRFDQLYMDGGKRAERRRSLSEEEQELGPECTFAPKINESRMSADGVPGLPLDVRMHLWQERKKQRLMLIRREAEKMEEEEAVAAVPISFRHGTQPFMERSSTCRPTAVLNDSTTLAQESHSAKSGIDAPTSVGSMADEETILKALQALENAERVSQYIMRH
ncbi:hypothetical protein MOQ_001433 [Trypanosoma cruzi marinkellei]|uniref:Uncharacterized protein n=1 Tax=Trypanosoma cruzi marinkellei TaxID=85056 RepID=K2NTJ3_TRYCR|nr:hypothetical protein MOQ_001433 [Trypanosoma cruzi marinkellei]